MCYHVINRGNGRARVFHKDADFAAFIELMTMAGQFGCVELFGFCLMPNHFHMVLRPIGDGDLSRWMHWLTSTHVRRYRRHYHDVGVGHVWQGRFKAFPAESGGHLLTVLCYVERNAARAGLVERAEDWPWSSLSARQDGRLGGLLRDWPVRRPDDWLARVNRPEAESELSAVRHCLVRGSPYGSGAWVARTADRLALTHTLRPRGRPRKEIVN
jgi:putative transposase